MKLKYFIQRNTEQHRLIIREYAELDKDILSLVCEEAYDENVVKETMSKTKGALLRLVRTEKLYPPILFVGEICDAIVEMFATESDAVRELQFDDLDFITKDSEKIRTVNNDDDEPEDIDELLDEDYDEDFEDKENIQNINTSLKVAEDDIPDMDDDL